MRSPATPPAAQWWPLARWRSLARNGRRRPAEIRRRLADGIRVPLHLDVDEVVVVTVARCAPPTPRRGRRSRHRAGRARRRRRRRCVLLSTLACDHSRGQWSHGSRHCSMRACLTRLNSLSTSLVASRAAGLSSVSVPALDRDAPRDPPPPPLTPGALVVGVLLDEAVLLQLAQVVAGRAARLRQAGRQLRGRRRAVDRELVAQLHAQRMGEALQRGGVELARGRSCGHGVSGGSARRGRRRGQRDGGPPRQPGGPPVPFGGGEAAGVVAADEHLLVAVASPVPCSRTCSWETTISTQRTLCKSFFATSLCRDSLCATSHP